MGKMQRNTSTLWMNRVEDEGLNILQINIQKQMDNLSILLREKDCRKFDIIAIQEPPINPFSSIGNWRTHNPESMIFDVYMPNSDTAPLVCFLINKTTMDKNKISITGRAGVLVSLDTEVEIQGEQKLISIHNIYNPCHRQNNIQIERGPFAGLPIDSALPHLEESLRKRSYRENIVVGDFNLWHRHWFGDINTGGKEGRQAKKLVEQMQDHDLQLCIPPDPSGYNHEARKQIRLEQRYDDRSSLGQRASVEQRHEVRSVDEI